MELGGNVCRGGGVLDRYAGQACQFAGMEEAERICFDLPREGFPLHLRRVRRIRARWPTIAETLDAERRAALTQCRRTLREVAQLGLGAQLGATGLGGAEFWQHDWDAWSAVLTPRAFVLAKLDRYYRDLASRSSVPAPNGVPMPPVDHPWVEQFTNNSFTGPYRGEWPRHHLALLETALAVRLFRLERGRYPGSLADPARLAAGDAEGRLGPAGPLPAEEGPAAGLQHRRGRHRPRREGRGPGQPARRAERRPGLRQALRRPLAAETELIAYTGETFCSSGPSCITELIQKGGRSVQIHISPADGVPIYQQIVNQVKYLVAAGRLREGEELPPIRALAERLVINPNTVARAYRELELQGLVTKRRTTGTYVSGAGSPLDRRERLRILSERIDALLAEARQLDVGTDEVIRLIRERERLMDVAAREEVPG
jgi:GntR family transcriptional regulator